MARQKKPVHRVQMTDGKRNIILQLLEEYDIETAEDIQDALKDLLGGTSQPDIRNPLRYLLITEQLLRSLSGVACTTPDTSKSQPTAYCFAQLKQGTCLIRLNRFYLLPPPVETCREWNPLMSDISAFIDVMILGSKGGWPQTDAYELLRCEAAPAILQTFEIR